jgi:hypothetical protein
MGIILFFVNLFAREGVGEESPVFVLSLPS